MDEISNFSRLTIVGMNVVYFVRFDSRMKSIDDDDEVNKF